MKRQFLFSAVAVLLAVSGAGASTIFADEYFAAGDPCLGVDTGVNHCPIGGPELCKEDNLQYYYRPDGTTECIELTRPVTP